MLTRPLPELPPIYFYDDHGSELFEQITRLPCYYQTRTEIAILQRHATTILDATRPRHLVELGSGAGRKIRLVLDALAQARCGESCTLLDVNQLFLEQSLHALRADYPRVRFRGLVGDFTSDLSLLGAGGDRLTLFFAGTMGNLYPDERAAFLRELTRRMERTDAVLLGVDLIKDQAVLEAAYNDPQGVTMAFNRNALRVVNQRFGGDFDPDAFDHRAFYAPHHQWIEMRLRARHPMRVHLRALDLQLDLEPGAEIRTEVSAKFTRESLSAAVGSAGLTITGWFTDPEQRFALALLRLAPA